jgi:L-asparaginase
VTTGAEIARHWRSHFSPGRKGHGDAVTDPPQIRYFAFGGTISGAPRPGSTEIVATLRGSDLVESVPGLADIARVDIVDFPLTTSFAVTLRQIRSLAGEVAKAFEDGVDGVVVSQGTDTMEETAYALALMLPRSGPIVLTGSMRSIAARSSDVQANIFGAFRVACSPAASSLGPIVVANDEIHAARFIVKMHTSRPSTFESPGAGPLGELVEGDVEVWWQPAWEDYIGLPPEDGEARVELVRVAVDPDDTLLRTIASSDVDGLVLEGTGGGHVPPALLPALDEVLGRGIPVVLATRVASGANLMRTYRAEGSETDLIERGVIIAGNLRGNKARLRLLFGLFTGIDPRQLFPVRASPSSGA